MHSAPVPHPAICVSTAPVRAGKATPATGKSDGIGQKLTNSAEKVTEKAAKVTVFTRKAGDSVTGVNTLLGKAAG